MTYYNMKPVIENYKTVWIPERCNNCGEYKIEEYEKGKYRCEKCKKEIEKTK